MRRASMLPCREKLPFVLLYTQLARDHLNEPGFDPFRDILRGCILDHWPKGAGDVVMGHVVTERRLHSLRTAVAETGIGAKMLVGTGRPQYRMTLDDLSVFQQRFVTLTTLSAETGQHRNTLKGVLASGRITPFCPEGQDFGPIYLRGMMWRGDRFAQ